MRLEMKGVGDGDAEVKGLTRRTHSAYLSIFPELVMRSGPGGQSLSHYVSLWLPWWMEAGQVVWRLAVFLEDSGGRGLKVGITFHVPVHVCTVLLPSLNSTHPAPLVSGV
uniref:Macaca fascicularis brain cDNA, clone: QflA-22029 n=1 Tax=Macaca fascicularis TaxID=9541 RepID=I7GDD3_MACFA|nr:unnamed protein product [Macaca fascicularis]